MPVATISTSSATIARPSFRFQALYLRRHRAQIVHQHDAFGRPCLVVQIASIMAVIQRGNLGEEALALIGNERSEERRVGKESRHRGWAEHRRCQGKATV